MAKKETWKPVTIGGLTGILMGAGTLYGAQAISLEAGEGIQASGLKSTSGNDDLSFAEAFNAARAELGPGGVFTWHGNIYNTYTADEWHAMTEDEHDAFAEEVNPEVGPEEIDVAEMEEIETNEEDVLIAENVQHEQPSGIINEATSWNELAQDENDVRVIGYGDVEIADGDSVTVQELDINGQRVAIIDLDKDGNPDVAMTDLNHNNEMDDGEVIDLHTGEAVSFTNDDIASSDYSSDIDPINT